MVALLPFRVGFGNTVVGGDPACPNQDKTVCQAFGYDAQEALAMAQLIADALNQSPCQCENEDRSMALLGWGV